MKAVILAAGKGTRMGEITKALPKPMVLVQGKPILEHIITGMRDSAGIKEFCLIVGYCGEVISDFFKDGSPFGVHIHYEEQVVQDGTGKAPELAEKWLDGDSFLLSYGDILVRASDYGGILHAFSRDGVIAVKGGQDLKHGGAVVLDEEGRLVDLIEKSSGPVPPNAWYNAGIYGFTRRVFEFTRNLEKSPRGEYELTDALREMALGGLEIKGWELKGDWADVRDPQILQALNRPA